jgi:hypothetical protein
MIESRIFTDPKAGIGYGFGERLPSANESEALAALRKLDRSIYDISVRSYHPQFKLTTGSLVDPVAAWDVSAGKWIFAYMTGGNVVCTEFDSALSHNTSLAATAFSGTIGFTGEPFATNDSGTYALGLAPSGATPGKILTAITPTLTSWTLRNIGSSNTKSVNYIKYDPVHGVFIAAVTTGEMYTSANASIWTLATIPGAFSSATWGGLAVSVAGSASGAGGGFAVAIPSSGTSYMTSPDGGVTWTSRTFPVNFNTSPQLSYHRGIDMFFCGGYASRDGIAWTLWSNAPSWSRMFGIGAMGVVLSASASVGALVQLLYGDPIANPSTLEYAGVIAAPYGGVSGHARMPCSGSNNHQFWVIVDDASSTWLTMSRYV